MLWHYRAEWGYDAAAHFSYIQSIARGSLPDPATNHVAYHPPLYHAIAAGFVNLGVTFQGLILLSVFCGILRLAIIWAGLEYCLPFRRARLAALALAAILPSSIMIDGMLGNESLLCLLSAAAIFLWLRCRSSMTIGIVSGLALLTKTSAIAMLVAFAMRRRLMAAAVCLTILPGLYLLRGHSSFATSYEMAPDRMNHVMANAPYLSRRDITFLGWDWEIYRTPYYPSANSRFLPVILASTFLDYYNHSFSGLRPDEPSDLSLNGRPLTVALLWMGRLAMIGGTIIFIGTVAAWAMSMRRLLRDRKWDQLCLLLLPLLASMIALAFAVKYPYPAHGVIKGAYIQFTAPPLYAMFGLALERAKWPMLAGLALVAAYSIYCRLMPI
jgi:hypothetical protein